MASTYVNNLRLNEMATGDQSGTWGTTTNTNLELIGQAFGWGTRAIANASTDNITIADGASDADRNMALKLTGGGQACTVTILPNTSSKVWIMENATSYTLTFTQGSGANVAILAGETKMIATDGLGSGAVVYDVLTDLNLAGTTKAAALTVAGVGTFASLDISGDVDVDGTANLDIVDIDGAVDMASTLTVAGVLTGASLDISGDIDIDGTTNLDVVDIDGAVDMASTLQVDGVATFTGRDIHSGGITIANAGQIGSVGDADAIAIASDGVVTLTQKLVGTELDISGNVDVDGTTNLDVVDIDGAVDMASTLTVAGVLTGASLDISGDVDVDGTLEADAITLNGTALGSLYSPIAGSGSIVTTGALNSGSITSGFGTINNGSSTITTTGAVATGAITAGGNITRGGTGYNRRINNRHRYFYC